MSEKETSDSVLDSDGSGDGSLLVAPVSPNRDPEWRRWIRTRLPGVVQIRSFRWLWVGQGISQFGDALYYLLFLYIVDKLTKDSSITGLAGALMQLPYLLVGFVAGVVADTVDRRKVMIFSDIGSALLMVVLLIVAIADRTPGAWVLLLIGFLLSAVGAFFDPARGAAIPMLVPHERLIEANSLSTSTRTFMQLLGPIGSAILIPLFASAGAENFLIFAVAVNLLTFVGSAYCIWRLPALVPKREGHALEDVRKIPWGSMMKEFMQGLNFINSRPVLRIGLYLTLVVNLLVAPVLVAFTAANRDWFQESERTFAGMQIAFFFGAVIGGLIVFRTKINKPGLSYCLGVTFAGLFLGCLAMAKQYWAFFGLNILCGIAVPFAMIPIQTYLQIVVPDELRGRVGSTISMLQNVLLPVGWFTAGWMIKGLGVEGLFIFLGVGLMIAGLAGFWFPTFRDSVMPKNDEEAREVAVPA